MFTPLAMLIFLTAHRSSPTWRDRRTTTLQEMIESACEKWVPCSFSWWKIRWHQTAELCYQHFLDYIGQSRWRSERYRPEGRWWDRCIRALSGIKVDPASSRYVRYNITLDVLILNPRTGALGGSSLSLLICCLAPGEKFARDTINTLQYIWIHTHLLMLTNKMYRFGKKSKTVENRLNNDRTGEGQVLKS